MANIIDEVRELTANEVAKKQEAAKLNYPKLVEQIKRDAALGNSSASFPQKDINEYDKKLLEQEGFSVNLTDAPKNKYESYDLVKSQHFIEIKIWIVRW